MPEIKIPFQVDSGGGIATISDPVASAGQHLETFIGTSPRERVMRPTFGTNAQRFLFEPTGSTALAALQQEMREAIATNVLDATVQRLTINANPTGNPQDGAIVINVAFTLANGSGSTQNGTAQVAIGGGTQ